MNKEIKILADAGLSENEIVDILTNEDDTPETVQDVREAVKASVKASDNVDFVEG